MAYATKRQGAPPPPRAFTISRDNIADIARAVLAHMRNREAELNDWSCQSVRGHRMLVRREQQEQVDTMVVVAIAPSLEGRSPDSPPPVMGYSVNLRSYNVRMIDSREELERLYAFAMDFMAKRGN